MYVQKPLKYILLLFVHISSPDYRYYDSHGVTSLILKEGVNSRQQRLHAFFQYKNNFIRKTKVKFGQKLRITQEQSRLGFGIIVIDAKFTFLNKILLLIER